MPHIVARFDGNGELGLNEVVDGARRVGAGLELAAVQVVLIVLPEPAAEIAEVARIRVQAGVRRRGAVFSTTLSQFPHPG
jgi:hypothetical protein